MKGTTLHLLSKRTLIALLGVFFLLTPVAFAQTATTSTSTPTAGASTEAGTQSYVKQAKQAQEKSSDSCEISNIGTCILDTAGFFIFGLANTLLSLSGLILNFVVVKTVFQFSTLIGNSPGLLVAWGILRDLGNMLLLFGFVFIGLSTILQINNYSFKKTLPNLLIFALLINFSLFAAEAVIDASNIFSTTFYNQANTSACTSGNTEDCMLNNGLAGHIMQSTGLSTMYTANGAGSGPASVTTFIGLSIFAMVGAVVFLAAAIMLTTRAVVLSFVMIASPIGFAGMALPPLKKFAKNWWSTLISQAFFAPVLLLLILISLKVADSFSKGGSLGEALANSGTNTAGILFIFTIVIGFLIGSLVAAKKFGAMGAEYATSFAGGLVIGTGASLGRRTMGRASNKISKTIRTSNFGASGTGRALAGVFDKGAKASYDIRASKAGGSVIKYSGLNVGKAKEGGYVKTLKTATDARITYANSLGQSTKNKALETQLNEQKKTLLAQKKTLEAGMKAEEGSFKEKKAKNDAAVAELARLGAEKTSAETSYAAEVTARQGRISATLLSGDMEAMTKERAELDEITKQHTERTTQREAEIANLRSQIVDVDAQHTANIKQFKDNIERVDKETLGVTQRIEGDYDAGVVGVGKNANKKRYADRMDANMNRNPLTWNEFSPFASGRARADAVDKIKGSLKKSHNDEIIEAFKKQAQEEAKEKTNA